MEPEQKQDMAAESEIEPEDTGTGFKDLIILTCVWCCSIAALILPADFFFGVDDYFHLAVAEKMQTQGLALDAFPWASCSVWVDSYFDKEWLFHLILIPFLWMGRLLGGKLAIIFLNFLIVLSLWLFARGMRVKHASWALLMIPLCSFGLFLQRVALCRPHVMSIATLFLCLLCILKRKRFLLVLAMAFYALSYTGHWQVVGLALAYDFWYFLLREDGRLELTRRFWPMTLFVVIGMAVGELLHPSFPANIEGLWLQNVVVLKTYWQGGQETLYGARPAEMRALPPGLFLAKLAPVLLSLVAIIAHWLKHKRKTMDRDLWVLGSYTGLYMLMALRSYRFVEYFVPVGCVFIVLYVSRNHILERLPKKVLAAALACIVIYGLAGSYFFVRQTGDMMVYLGNQPHYAGCTSFIRQNLKPGELVYSMYWSDNPQLFWGAPEQKYLVFLDPLFMQRHSPELFELWNRLRTEEMEDPVGILRGRFGARAVFIRRTYRDGRPQILKFESYLKKHLGEASFVSKQGHMVFLIPPATSPTP